MEFEKVMKLIDAGFTADEIRAMNAKAEAPKETPKEAPKEAPKETPKEAPKEAPKETPTDRPKEEAKEAPKDEKPAYIKELEDHVNELFASMDKLSKVIVNPSIADVKPVGIEDVIKKIVL